MVSIQRKKGAPKSPTANFRTAVLAGVSLMTIAGLAMPAFAQTTQPSPGTGTGKGGANSDTMEDIIVTGIIGSLQRNLDIKREADGIVDAISAEDIGKFPDSNVAASMQRIPGVSISRGTSSMGGVPTSTGDATAITVRGFGPSFNETLFDGRVSASAASSGRGFDFSSVSSDFVGQIDVLKSPDASLSAGAIGATVNIKFPKPLEHSGFRATGSVSGSYASDADGASPNGAFLVSDTFAHDTFGILLAAGFNETQTLGNHVNSQGWIGTTSDKFGSLASGTPSGVPAWFIQDYGLYQEHSDTIRKSGRLALQWQPSDQLEITLNDDFQREDAHQNQYGYSIWFNSGALQNVKLNSNGSVTDFVQPNTPTDFQAQYNSQVLQNNLYGLNVKWTPTNNWKITVDAARSESWQNPGDQLTSLDADVGYGSCASGTCINTNNVGITGVAAGALPYPTVYGPNGDASHFTNGFIGSHVFPMSSTRNYNVIDQGKAEAEWKSGDTTIRFGMQYIDNKEDLSSYDTFTNSDWQAYSGYGPASGSPTGVALPQDWFTKTFSTSNFIPGFANNGNLPPQILMANPGQILNYLQSLGNPQTKNIPGFNYGCCTPPFDGTYRLILSPGSKRDIEEETFAPYVAATFKTQVADMPLKVNVGAREEITHVTSSGLGQTPTAFTVTPGDKTAFTVAYGPVTTVSGTNNYQFLLPNLDLTLGVTDDLQVRFNASRTLTRPPLNNMTPVYSISTQRVGTVSASGGNPQLMPYLSDNVDIGAEYYYQRNSYVAIDGFMKSVTNFVVGGTSQKSFAGVLDPTTGKDVQYAYSTYLNGPSAQVYGLEMSIQHVFDDTGFGFQANATVVGTDKPYDPNNLSVSGFAVTGLANSANFVGFYDKYGFQARVAVNWRDEYLDHFGQAQGGSIYGSEPTFVDAAWEVDFSTSYDINEYVSVYFEALNLTNETYSTHGRYKEQLLDAVAYGQRYTVGAHFKY
ncbi:TonB-dependent receptor [Nitrospirillum amazonense]|uniref:TonB-dependent receptor n=2 Tax=Nitrospirillum amazonense TaxID=28077 RepID=A0A560JLB5_9PROT|nr:TonB-dependent receptor [Nitrospirillum amazonense]